MFRKLLTLCLVLFTLLSYASAPVQAAPLHSAADDDVLAGLLERMVLVTAALHSKGYSIAHIGVDRLALGNSQINSRDLYSGNDYLVVGLGGVGVSDLDIVLYDANGRKLDEDNSADNTPMVAVSPLSSGKFQIALNLYSLEPGYSRSADYFYVYVIAYK